MEKATQVLACKEAHCPGEADSSVLNLRGQALEMLISKGPGEHTWEPELCSQEGARVTHGSPLGLKNEGVNQPGPSVRQISIHLISCACAHTYVCVCVHTHTLVPLIREGYIPRPPVDA